MSAHSARKPWWQQATALVTVTTGGVITGFSFVPGAAATMTSPTSMPLHLLALQKAATEPTGSDDAALRSAIVNVAGYYLRLARSSTPAQMEAMIWGKDSIDGADHGPSCAAFASLTLELAAQAAGKQSWVTGGTTYPWPLHGWADVRVDPNPDSLDITSIVQDAQAHDRWHPIGDGYTPQPGDWVLFSGHVEVVTGYTDGTLDTIGADSLPNLTVNAHAFPAPLADQGVEGFVDNGHLADAAQPAPAGAPEATQPPNARAPKAPSPKVRAPDVRASKAPGLANIPGMGAARPADANGLAAIPGVTAAPGPAPAAAGAPAAHARGNGPYTKYTAPEPAPAPHTRTQQAFISQIAPGAIAAAQRYGVPASVTIAQAIEESGWGHSTLATRDHNLFGIKGTGPAGSVDMPTQEYSGGHWVTINASFRKYHNIAESISDHAELLATSGYYTRAMADRAVPDAFANDLAGIYATDPEYGGNLIALMRLYNLYRFDVPPPAPAASHPPASGTPANHVPASHVPAAHTPTAHAPVPHAPVPHAPVPHAPVPQAPVPQAPVPQAPVPQAPVPQAPGSAAIPGAVPIAGNAAGSAAIPGYAAVPGYAAAPARARARGGAAVRGSAVAASPVSRGAARIPGLVAPSARYRAQLPTAVTTAFFASAKTPLARAEPLYRDVASRVGIRWELLAACDWMQCQAHPRYSPVHGEKIGMPNPDGTVYQTKSEALAQCGCDLAELAAAVYGVNLTATRTLSVRALADAFAAFRWGALLKRHGVSAMEFPYSVAGLTAQHLKMHWPAIDEPDAPDKPGGRFRMPFGAVPVVLSLNYPATI